jgi:hypothetical protein
MVTDFRKKGIIVPEKVIDDLRNAKTTIYVSKADPSYVENAQKIEQYVGNIESYLVTEGTKRFGQEYVDRWFIQVDEAAKKIVDDQEETRFIPGLPRQRKWVRVAASAEVPLEKLKKLAEQTNLSHIVQGDGSLLVYGEDNPVKDFVKKLAEKYRSKTGKQRGKVRNC